MVHEVSLSSSQQNEYESTPYSFSLFRIHLNIILPTKPRFTQCYTLLKIYHRISACVSVLSVRITCIPKLITADLKRVMKYPSPYRMRNTIRKLVIKLFSAVSCCFLLLKSKYFPQHSVLEMPDSIFLPYCENNRRIMRIAKFSQLCN